MQVEDVLAPSDTLLDEIDALLMRAYGSGSRRSRVERFLAVEHGGWVLLRDADRVVGVGGYVGYPIGGFGWIGLVATDPDAERRGFGRIVTQALADRLTALGCWSVLDGSAKGAPLYERMGFVDHGESRLFLAPTDIGPGRGVPLGLHNSTIEEIGLTRVSEYDAVAFGADRSSLLRLLGDLFVGRSVVLCGADGRVVGYGIAQDDGIGPVVADDDTTGALIVDSLLRLSWDAAPWLIVPPGSLFAPAAESMGFVLQRSLRRQHLGIGTLPGRRELICAQISFGEG